MSVCVNSIFYFLFFNKRQDGICKLFTRVTVCNFSFLINLPVSCKLQMFFCLQSLLFCTAFSLNVFCHFPLVAHYFSVSLFVCNPIFCHLFNWLLTPFLFFLKVLAIVCCLCLSCHCCLFPFLFLPLFSFFVISFFSLFNIFITISNLQCSTFLSAFDKKVVFSEIQFDSFQFNSVDRTGCFTSFWQYL